MNEILMQKYIIQHVLVKCTLFTDKQKYLINTIGLCPYNKLPGCQCLFDGGKQ